MKEIINIHGREIYEWIQKIFDILIQNRAMLAVGFIGNTMNCIAVYKMFGKRKYDWFFPVACAVRYIFYNIGFLAIWNVLYGTQRWYKLTMSTFAVVTALGLVIISAILWKEALVKVLTGVFAAECINDGVMYQVMKLNISLLQQCLVAAIIFLILYFIIWPLLEKYRTYTIKHEVLCLTVVFTFFIGGWVSNLLYDTSESLQQKPMYMLVTCLLIGGCSALIIAFSIHTRNVFQRKKELEKNKKQMENYYQEIQCEIKELDDFKETVENALEGLNTLNSNLSQTEKQQQVYAYIESLKMRYQNLNQLFFCEDYLVDGILTDFAMFCKQQGIEVDLLFQNYHRGNIRNEDSIAILLKLIEYAKKAGKVRLHAGAIKNQLIYSMELEKKESGQESEIYISKRKFRKYVKKYEGEIHLERSERVITLIIGLRRA